MSIELFLPICRGTRYKFYRSLYKFERSKTNVTIFHKLQIVLAAVPLVRQTNRLVAKIHPDISFARCMPNNLSTINHLLSMFEGKHPNSQWYYTDEQIFTLFFKKPLSERDRQESQQGQWECIIIPMFCIEYFVLSNCPYFNSNPYNMRNYEIWYMCVNP